MFNQLKTILITILVLLFVVSISAQKGEEIIRRERFFYDSLKEKKKHLLPDLFMENFHGVFGGGFIDKKAEIEGFKSAILIDYKFSEITVKFPAKNVGIMIYRSFIKGMSKGEVVTGESYRTSTWVKNNGKWKMILHTDVPVGNTLANKNKRIEKRKMKVLGLATIVYKVPDLTKAKEWYAKAFGEKQYFDEPFYVGFSINGYELGLLPEEEKKSVKGDGSVTYWSIKDIEATFKKFIELGATAHEKPTSVGGELMVASVKDPWGNIIGFIYNPEFKEMKRK